MKKWLASDLSGNRRHSYGRGYDPVTKPMTAADPLPPNFDERIAAAFANGAKSADVATLIEDSNLVAKWAAELAEQARTRAFDPALSADSVADARRAMDDAAFKRDRLRAALTKLGERLKELQDDRRGCAAPSHL
jgi:hypothetical protein